MRVNIFSLFYFMLIWQLTYQNTRIQNTQKLTTYVCILILFSIYNFAYSLYTYIMYLKIVFN